MVQRVLEGHPAKQVAQLFGVREDTLGKWVTRQKGQGDQALAAHPSPGRTPKLTPAQQQEVLTWFDKTPQDLGIPRPDWHANEVAWAIKKTFGVDYHPHYLNNRLKQWGVTPQKPKPVARERDAPKVRRWCQESLPAAEKKGTGARRTRRLAR